MPVLHLRTTMPEEVFRAVDLAEWNPAGILAGKRRLPRPKSFLLELSSGALSSQSEGRDSGWTRSQPGPVCSASRLEERTGRGGLAASKLSSKDLSQSLSVRNRERLVRCRSPLRRISYSQEAKTELDRPQGKQDHTGAICSYVQMSACFVE
jgi:hypothetical protein